ncbi:MAG: hypothetical protein WCD66_08045 [Rhodanobacteraceae bacterium]
MTSPATLMWGILFGSIGLGFFLYGKRQRMIVPLFCGIALMAYPYFVSATWALVLIGVVLMAVPYFLRY